MRRYHASLLFLAFTVFWSITEELALRTPVSAYQVVWMRYGIHVAAMLLLIGPRQGTALIRTPDLGRQIGRSLLMLGMPLCFIVAFSRVPIRNALAALWVVPLLLLLIDRVFVRETRGWTLPLITVLGFTGTMLIIRPSPPFGWSTLIPIAGSLCFAVYITMTRAMRHDQLLPKMFHTALWVFLALTPFVPFFWVTPTWQAVFLTALVALFGWITLYCLDRAVDQAPPAWLAPIMYCIVVWPEVVRWGVSHAAPGHLAIVGTLVVAGVATVAVWRPAIIAGNHSTDS